MYLVLYNPVSLPSHVKWIMSSYSGFPHLLILHCPILQPQLLVFDLYALYLNIYQLSDPPLMIEGLIKSLLSSFQIYFLLFPTLVFFNLYPEFRWKTEFKSVFCSLQAVKIKYIHLTDIQHSCLENGDKISCWYSCVD
jgi:hypothetical protein